MNKVIIGKIIKQRREELGVLQKDLCEGICSIATLSRIENGEISNSWGKISKLLERLGCSNVALHEIECDEDYRVAQEMREAVWQSSVENYTKAWEILDSVSENYELFSTPNQQFYDFINTMLLKKQGLIDNFKAIDNLTKTLCKTFKKFDMDNLPLLLTHEEIMILNCLGTYYGNVGEYGLAIKTFYHIKSVFENVGQNRDVMLNCFNTVLYNLSKYLGLSQRYDECIEICKQCIKFQKDNDRTQTLPQTMYNYSWALLKRGQADDLPFAKELAEDAYNLSRILGNRNKRTAFLKNYLEENFK